MPETLNYPPREGFLQIHLIVDGGVCPLSAMLDEETTEDDLYCGTIALIDQGVLEYRPEVGTIEVTEGGYVIMAMTMLGATVVTPTIERKRKAKGNQQGGGKDARAGISGLPALLLV